MPFNPLPVVYTAAPSDPTGTTNTSGLMMGLAGSVTPNQTGRLFVMVTGNLANGTIADGAKVRLRLGTGAAPANAGALAGTVYGKESITTAAGGAANDKVPFVVQAVITTLTVGTAYWIDIDLAAIVGGTASATEVQISALEV